MRTHTHTDPERGGVEDIEMQHLSSDTGGDDSPPRTELV